MPSNLKLFYYFAREKPLTFWIIVSGLLTSTLIIWIPGLQGDLIDSVFLGLYGLPTRIMIFAGFVVLVQFLRFWKRYLVRKFENRTVREIRKKIYDNILNSSIESMEQHNAGSLMNKIIGDVNIVSEGLRKIITEIFDTVVMLSGYIILMAISDIRITLFALMFIPIGVAISTGLKKIVSNYNSVFREAKGDVNNLIYQNVTHAVLFRLMGLQEQFGEMFKDALPALRKKAVRASFFDSGLTPIYNSISLIGGVFVIILGARNIQNDIWSLGQFSAYLIMFALVARKAGMISTYITLWHKTVVSWQRLKEHLQPPAEKSEESNKVANLPQPPVSLKFSSVSLNGLDGTNLFEGLSFEASTGQIIGIAGPVASGKSAFMKLFTTVKPTLGEITINGEPVSSFSIAQKSELIAYKPHFNELFSSTVAENICFDEHDDIKLNRVLFETALSDDVENMSKGLNTRLGGNTSVLSGGQTDRVNLARALFTNKPILVLDDPFSALDRETEAHIMEQLRINYKNSLILLSSHRFTVFPQTDAVILFDGNGGYTVGTHNELMDTNPLYKEIFHLQIGEKVRDESEA